MKYFIGSIWNGARFIDDKRRLEQIMAELGVEKDENETEIASKITEEICRHKISVGRLLEKITKHNTLFLTDETHHIIGILVFEIDVPDSTIEIHYLCSMEKYKGNGKVLLDKIKEYAKLANINKITLSPGLDRKVVEYYINNDFEIKKWDMVYNVPKGGKSNRKKKKSNRKITIKRRNHKKTKTRKWHRSSHKKLL